MRSLRVNGDLITWIPDWQFHFGMTRAGQHAEHHAQQKQCAQESPAPLRASRSATSPGERPLDDDESIVLWLQVGFLATVNRCRSLDEKKQSQRSQTRNDTST